MSILIAYICALMLVGASTVQLLIAVWFRQRFISTGQVNQKSKPAFSSSKST